MHLLRYMVHWYMVRPGLHVGYSLMVVISAQMLRFPSLEPHPGGTKEVFCVLTLHSSDARHWLGSCSANL